MRWFWDGCQVKNHNPDARHVKNIVHDGEHRIETQWAPTTRSEKVISQSRPLGIRTALGLRLTIRGHSGVFELSLPSSKGGSSKLRTFAVDFVPERHACTRIELQSGGKTI